MILPRIEHALNEFHYRPTNGGCSAVLGRRMATLSPFCKIYSLSFNLIVDKPVPGLCPMGPQSPCSALSHSPRIAHQGSPSERRHRIRRSPPQPDRDLAHGPAV